MSGAGRAAWMDSLRPYLKWTILAMLALGFASGLPLMMVFSKLSAWLRESGIDRSTIGGLYAVSLAYSLKFLWAPVVDRVRLPGLRRALGKRRSWMLLAVVGTILGLLVIGTSDPSVALQQTIIGALILAFSGATLDIAVDAWRIESAPNEEQANMAAVYNLGYRFAIMMAGFGLVIADQASWLVAYAVMAGLMGLIGLIVVFFVREPTETIREKDAPKGVLATVRGAVIEPFWQFVAKFGPWVFVVFSVVALYRISDFTMGVMATPFYIDLGYSKSTIGSIQGLFGPWPIIVGGFVGGFVAIRFGLMPSLLAGAFLTLVTNGAFAALALAAGPDLDAVARAVSLDIAPPEGAVVNTPSTWALLGVIVADNLAAGFVGSVFIAYMSALVDREFAATQYALMSSAYAFFCKIAASTTSGPLSEAVGWAWFFTITAMYTLPPAILILILVRYGPAVARGVREPPSERFVDTDIKPTAASPAKG